MNSIKSGQLVLIDGERYRAISDSFKSDGRTLVRLSHCESFATRVVETSRCARVTLDTAGISRMLGRLSTSLERPS